MTARRNTTAPDFSRSPQGVIQPATIPPRGVRRINRAVVQCAEELVFSSRELASVEALIKKYARYRVELDFIEIRNPGSFMFGMHTRVREQT